MRFAKPQFNRLIKSRVIFVHGSSIWHGFSTERKPSIALVASARATASLDRSDQTSLRSRMREERIYLSTKNIIRTSPQHCFRVWGLRRRGRVCASPVNQLQPPRAPELRGPTSNLPLAVQRREHALAIVGDRLPSSSCVYAGIFAALLSDEYRDGVGSQEALVKREALNHHATTALADGHRQA